MEFIYNGKVVEGVQYTGDNFNEIKYFIKDSTDITTYTIFVASDEVNTDNMTRSIKYNIVLDDPKKRVENIRGSAEDQSLARIFDNASQRYLINGDWVFHNKEKNRYYCKLEKVVKEKYTPLYFMSHNYINTIELPEFDEKDNIIRFILDKKFNDNEWVLYHAIRYTGKNAKDIMTILDEYNDNSKFSRGHYYYMEKSMNHDINDPVLIINKMIIDDYTSDKSYQMFIMYPGDYIMFDPSEYAGRLYIKNKIISTKNFFRVAEKMCKDQFLTIKREES